MLHDGNEKSDKNKYVKVFLRGWYSKKYFAPTYLINNIDNKNHRDELELNVNIIDNKKFSLLEPICLLRQKLSKYKLINYIDYSYQPKK